MANGLKQTYYPPLPDVRRSELEFSTDLTEPHSENSTEIVSMEEQEEQLPVFRTRGTVTAVEAGGQNRQDELEEQLENLDGRELQKVENRLGREFPATSYIRVKPEEAIEWVPGQFVGLHYNGVPRAYSIANAPDNELEFCVRRVPDGKLSPQLCEDISVGDELYLKGPDTLDLLLQDPSERDMVFMATGTGVAPLRGMIDYTFDEGWDEFEGEKRDVWLFLGASWEDDLPYHDELQELDDLHENFHYVPTASREAYLNEDWTGETAYIQDCLTTYLTDEAKDNIGVSAEPAYDIQSRIDPENIELYLCGITAMVKSVDETVRELGIDEQFYQDERFG